MLVCLCRAVSDRTLQRAIDRGASSVQEVMRCTGAGTCCGSCRPAIAAMLEASASDGDARSASHVALELAPMTA
jgi:bacterioferritin-associated ferredoxin